jgi:acetyl-CoA carboxylase biotin carboxylase subunit
MKMIKKILVANRGEIALRIARTCRALGISSVAVYSDADLHSPHARYADEAVRIGPPPSNQSYLLIDAIIEAANRTGADAVHPGYGFLAENADFAQACADAGLIFIGPSPEAIRKMGLKSAAREIMSGAGVAVVPGYHGDDQSFDTLSDSAREIGFPVLIKASAGGGGKGMRVVREISEMGSAIESARREAEKSFGDGSLLLEKYVEQARHVEFQIFGDNYGNIVHLFERDCSIQRRHQKIIEESPSPAVSEQLRQSMGEAAVAAGRAIKYTNAGTVEFILSPAGEFYFIEVNTRLQVEHPVTEMITGLDLVRLQIEVAEGRPLNFKQEEITISGHAVEARLYAEDPDNDFLPATGTICDWNPPSSVEGLRLDSGVERGSEIGIYYDPMLAKVIAHGADRETSLRKLAYGLRSLSIQGVQTNRDFLIRLVEHNEFLSGVSHTSFISEHLGELTNLTDAKRDAIAAVVVALYLQSGWRAADTLLPSIPPAYRNNPYRNPSIKLQVGEQVFEVAYSFVEGDGYEVLCGDWQFHARVLSFEAGKIRLSIDGLQRLYRIAEDGEKFFIHSIDGSKTVLRLPRYPERQADADRETANAQMPGQVLKILVSEGQKVAAGDALIILEAMKMEQTIKAMTDGIVEAILVKVGETVAPGAALIKIGCS